MAVRKELDEAHLATLDRARQTEKVARERDNAEKQVTNLKEDIKAYRDRVHQHDIDGDGRLRRLEQERSQRRLL